MPGVSLDHVKIFPSGEPFVTGAASLLISFIREKLQQQEICTVVLAGGNTPRSIYQYFTELPAEGQPDWKRIHFFWGDERTVPPTHPESNYRMVAESLLNHLSIPESNIHRMKGELPPAQAAEDYRKQLHQFFQGRMPAFDLVILGLGADGHTASLFPGTTAVKEKEKWVTEVYVEQLNTWRITLTFPVINHAQQIVFLVAGTAKAAILEKLMNLVEASPTLPASLVKPETGEVMWLLDEAAGRTGFPGDSGPSKKVILPF
ncbi:MAG: 6-phosphogluconolactonase [Methanobacteriota archaeon]|nr:MAG: 6-phosphogluconolactonase [Euryarchaeota archaeon]